MMSFPSTMLSFVCLALSASLVASACVTVSNFDELKNAVNVAGASLTLCPFDIAKPATSNLIFANKVIRLSCERATDTDKCVLRGQGNIIRIQQPESEVMFDGFTFQGATQAAVRIAPTSPKTQTLHDCEFLQNEGSIDGGWRGGAIKTEPGTSLVVSSCRFIGNTASQGGAIFHRGDFMSVVDSAFEDNFAKQVSVYVVLYPSLCLTFR
jgi:predicted outer membrane repeat protein